MVFSGTDGAPVSQAVAQQAVQWWVELRESEISAARLTLWRRWREADAAHEAAWQRIETVGGRFADIPTPLARAVLSTPSDSLRRRRSMQLLTVLVVAGGSALAVRQATPWRAWTADHVSGVGDRQTVQLPDGGSVVLNTDSAVNVRFDADRRVLQLVRGEIRVQTAQDALRRPFFVETEAGAVRAIGTRFTVRERGSEGGVDVGVQQGAVELRPADAPAASRILQAGEAGSFTRTRAMYAGALDSNAGAWADDGMLVVSRMRLDGFLAEVGRYRKGRLGCDPAVAGLQVSGAYPLDDTDRILAALTSSLPVEVHTYTRYWVTVHARKNK